MTRLKPRQGEAAAQAWAAAAGLLASGAQAAGPVLQNELLRAVHSCRVAGLHRLAQAGQRAAQQIDDLHARRPEFRLSSLAWDVHQVLAVAHAISRATNEIDHRWVGEARRGYSAVGALNLQGLFTEPVSSASGYAGVVTMFVDDEDRLWSLGDVAPGDVSRCRFAYIEHFALGQATLQHRAVGREGLRLDHATASANRRLSSGRGVSAEAIDGITWWQPPLDRLWSQPMDAQLQRIWSVRTADERHAGDDLLFVRATIAGAHADSLILRTGDVVLRGISPTTHVELAYRDNLDLLSSAVGLQAWLIGRVVAARPRTVQVLAVGGPELRVPEDWRGRVNLGLDRLKPAHLPSLTRGPGAQFPELGEPPADPLAALERRLEQVLLGGRSVLMLAAFAHDEALLQRNQMPTAAALLRRLRQADELAEAWLAARIYLTAAQSKLQREQWLT